MQNLGDEPGKRGVTSAAGSKDAAACGDQPRPGYDAAGEAGKHGQ